MEGNGSGLAWLGFWLMIGLVNFQSCSVSEEIYRDWEAKSQEVQTEQG